METDQVCDMLKVLLNPTICINDQCQLLIMNRNKLKQQYADRQIKYFDKYESVCEQDFILNLKLVLSILRELSSEYYDTSAIGHKVE